MNKRGCIWMLAIAGALVLIRGLLGCFYAVHQIEQVIVTQFGKPVGDPVTDPGLHFKLPFIQEVNRIDKRFLEWDGQPVAIPTRDKTYIHVDTFARWRIDDPTTYFVRLTDERSAQSRLEDVLGSETRNAIAKHDLIEIVRTDKNRKPMTDESLKPGPVGIGTIGVLPPIAYGRLIVEADIKAAAAVKLKEFGIELLDVRFKRINYNPAVGVKIFDRMTSERRQIAERFRSEGAGEAAKIMGSKERDLKEIESEAYRTVQGVQGKADAEATAIYAQAYNATPEAREFYSFTRTLDTYRTVFLSGTTVVLTTEGSFLHLLKGEAPSGAAPKPPTAPAVPAAAPANP
jgi:modulator of FtsH protease HflC